MSQGSFLYNQPMTWEEHHSETRRTAAETKQQHEYAAFISYRHLPKDQEVAKQVQHAIETFRLPRGINAPGHTDGHLGKCFRDEDELSASHSLPARILDALAKSSSLVVICSPEAHDSVWVNREIAAFIEMHGRERIFAVLAYGSSAESIPPLLRTETAVPGSAEATAANPLAADLRPTTAKKKRDEMLRIIAAVADCSFDDLRQRGRTRTIKRGIAIAVAAVLIVAAIAAALSSASAARQETLVAESRQLAAESSQLLAQGDRYGAIEKALQALPQSEASADRPLVPEARAALEINTNPSSPWWASYEITTQAPLGLIDNTLANKTDDETELAGAITVSDTGGFFAVSDSAGNINTYDTLTGKKLADCAMPAEATPLTEGWYARSMAATENYLIVLNASDNGTTLVCFDAKTGSQTWSLPNTGGPSYDTSYGADLISMAFPLATGGYNVTIMDLASGRTSSAAVDDTEIVDTSTPYFNTPGPRLGTNYAAFGNQLFSLELDTSESNRTTLAYANVTSLAYLDQGLIIAASADPMPDDDVTRRYAIEAFDENLTPVWRQDGTFTSEMIVNNGITSLLAAEPAIHNITGSESGIIVSVGRQALVLDPSDGAPITTLSFDQSVVDARLASGASIAGDASATNPTPDDPGFISVACSNGAINCINLLNPQDVNNDAKRLVLPFPIRWAHLTQCGDYHVIVAIPADAENRIVSYRTDWSRGEDTGDQYSLDELRAFAEQTLDEAGRIG